MHRSFLTYVATVVQAEVKDGQVKIHRVDSALDAPPALEGIQKRWAVAPQVYERLSKQPKKDCPISLQNHGDEAWFRNIRIRSLSL